MTTFFAAGIIPAFEDIATDLGVTLPSASYLTSAMIIVLGFGPLFWKPLANRFGRRPIWLISTSISGFINIAIGLSKTYTTMMVFRCLLAFFISPAIAIGSGVVVETFFKNERGRYMGIWTLMVTLGPPGAPLIMGFVVQRLSYRWIFYIDAIVSRRSISSKGIADNSRSTLFNSLPTSSSDLRLVTFVALLHQVAVHSSANT